MAASLIWMICFDRFVVVASSAKFSFFRVFCGLKLSGLSGLGVSHQFVAAPEDNKVKFTVTPKVEEGGDKPDSFFFCVKMK
jgi:hypothetical protein